MIRKGGETMHAQRFLIGSALIILTGCQHMVVRDSMPTVTRTGEVKDVVIRENVSPATLTANPGDEIRWVNKRQGDVRVIFLNPVMEMLTCQRNFGGLVGADRNQYTAKLKSNDTASLCFRSPTEVKYVVRAESSDPSGEQNLAGTIMISSEDQARRPIEKSEPQATQSGQEELPPNR
jgi:plastocyanin